MSTDPAASESAADTSADARSIWFGASGPSAPDSPGRRPSNPPPSSRLARLVRPGTPLRRLVELRALASTPLDAHGHHLHQQRRRLRRGAGGGDKDEDDEDTDDEDDSDDRFADAREMPSVATVGAGPCLTSSVASSAGYSSRPSSQRGIREDGMDPNAFSPCSSGSGLTSNAGTEAHFSRQGLPRAAVFYHPSSVKLPPSHFFNETPAPHSLVKAAVNLFESCADDDLDDNASDYPHGALRPDAEPHEEARFYHASYLYDNDDTYIDSDEEAQVQTDRLWPNSRNRQDTPLSYPSLDLHRDSSSPPLKRQVSSSPDRPASVVSGQRLLNTVPESPSSFYSTESGFVRQVQGRPNSIRHWVASRRAVSSVRPTAGRSQDLAQSSRVSPLLRMRSFVPADFEEPLPAPVPPAPEQNGLNHPLYSRPSGHKEPWSCPGARQASRFAAAKQNALLLQAAGDGPLSAREVQPDAADVAANLKFMELMELSASAQSKQGRTGREKLFARIGRRFGFGT
jgi:hypothetical protein